MAKKKKLTIEEKFEYMRIGLNLAGVRIDRPTVEIVIRCYEEIIKDPEKFGIMEASRINSEVIEKYNRKSLEFRQTREGYLKEFKEEIEKLKAVKESIIKNFPPRKL